ncbi:sulfatase-like hydrolase/transferase [Candidatus Uhrbacteria bacterium]|nr:sulfatase-like hydrolase/transferase [Candidatus Uhrbacteria bacterium]
MRQPLRSLRSTVWLGLALTISFFYPLLVTLYDQARYLQWTRVNTWELISAIALGAVGGAITLRFIDRIERTVPRILALLAVMSVPLMSFGVHALRQLRFTDTLIGTHEWVTRHGVVSLVMGLAAVLVISLLVRRWLSAVERVLWGALLFLSLLTFFAALTIARVWPFDTQTTIAAVPAATAREGGHMLLFLFDELSYEYLYDANGNVRDMFPNFQRFAASATNYHRARAPGRRTLRSVPGYLRGEPVGRITVAGDEIFELGSDGEQHPLTFTGEHLFARARALGYTTAIVGPAFQYCVLLASSLDRCWSYSTYNYAGIHSSFSVWNPVATTMILWPRQLPQGWVKRPLYAHWQRRGIAEVTAFVRDVIRAPSPAFLFAHVYLPHLPFAFDRNGYAPAENPFEQSPENYTRQLAYVDTWFGEVLATLDAQGRFSSSTIVVLSDHNFRAQTPSDEWDHVPFIVKGADQREHGDIDVPTRIEEALSALVSASSPQ